MKRLLSLILASVLCLPLASCSTQVPAASDEALSADDLVQAIAEPEQAIGNTYTYTETVAEYGFSAEWALTFLSETECTLFEPNEMMGDTTYTCSYTFAGEQYTLAVTASDSGQMPLSSMFDDQYTCICTVWQDGSFEPALTDAGGDLNGQTGGGSENADFAAVPYASESPSQVMDIYLPENAAGSDPVIVLVHGGGFQFGDQTMELIQPVIEAGTANGYAVASVDYRKSGEAAFPAALSDVKAAVRFLRANAEEYGIDPERVVIWGESAGAYLSLMTALTPEVSELNRDVTENLEESSSVSALVDFYGPVEFYTMDAEYEALGIAGTSYSSERSFESAFLGQAVGLDEEFTYTTWWGTYTDQLPEDYSLYVWIQAGDSDSSVPYTQSQNFAQALAELIGDEYVSFGLISGAEHEDPLFYTEENLAQVFAFLADAGLN